MCVKFIKKVGEFNAYDPNKPLKEQMVGCTQVLFDCKPDDQELYRFFQEMYLLLGDINIDRVAKALSSNFQKAEDRLDEIQMICANRE